MDFAYYYGKMTKKLMLIIGIILFASLCYADDWEWIQVKDLEVGDVMMDQYGNEIPIESIESVHDEQGVMVYDLDVEDDYYFAEGVLVHNSEQGIVNDANPQTQNLFLDGYEYTDEEGNEYRAYLDEDKNLIIEKKEGNGWKIWKKQKMVSIEDKAEQEKIRQKMIAQLQEEIKKDPALYKKYQEYIQSEDYIKDLEKMGFEVEVKDDGTVIVKDKDGKVVDQFNRKNDINLASKFFQAKTQVKQLKLKKDHELAEQAVQFAIQNALTTFLGPIVDEQIQKYCQNKASSSAPETMAPTTVSGGMPAVPEINFPRPPIRGDQDTSGGIDSNADETIEEEDTDGTTDVDNDTETIENPDDELCSYILSSSGELYARNITNGYDWRYTWTSCDKDLNIRVFLQCETKQITLDSRMIKEGTSLQNSGIRKTLEECKKICIEYPDKRCVQI